MFLAVLVALAAVGAVATAGSSAAVGGPQVAFTGEGAVYTLDGTFTLDHFAVKTPRSFPDLLPDYHPGPRLVAVGTADATQTYPFGPASTYADTPFVWVDLGVAATCGGAVKVQFNLVDGSEYTGFGPLGGQNLWDGTVPLPAWDGTVHWGMLTTSPALTLPGTRGDSCAAAQLARSPKTLTALAGALNRLLHHGS